MKISNNTQNFYNPKFGAIFNFQNDGSYAANSVLRALKTNTVADEAKKLERKFMIGIGQIYVYVPDEKLELLKNKLNCALTQDMYQKYLERVD